MKPSSPFYILWLLVLCVGVVACTTEGERRQMAQIIAEADSMNRNYVPMTSDSLLLQACAFYDRHGTANERMKAHYLLGCVYRDLGEAPRAIDCYQEAADCADTLDNDCDYRMLGCIYSQMGDVFHQQLLLSNEIEARKQSHRFGLLAGDTLGAIFSINLTGGVYIILNKLDSAEILIHKAMKLFHEHGYNQYEMQSSTMLMYMYVGDTSKLTGLGKLIESYDNECNLFDEKHELHSRNRQFYYYKGRYFEMTERLDSAEYYYRKINYNPMPYTMQNSMYEGLLSVFQKRQVADSIAKYAQLYCEVNDSSIAIKDQDLTARLAASYNYARYQREALVHERNANFARMTLIVVIALSLFIAIIVVFSWLRYKQKKENELNEQKAKYANTVDIYDHNMQALRVIYESREASFEETKEKLAYMENELRSENKQLQETITELQRQMDLKKAVDHARNYFIAPIVLHVIDLSKNPLKSLTETEKDELFSTTSEYFPTLIQHLKHADITSLGIQVCILVILKIQPGSIANLLGISIQQVTNLKSAIGQALFNDRSARTLYKNLVQRYDVYVS